MSLDRNLGRISIEKDVYTGLPMMMLEAISSIKMLPMSVEFNIITGCFDLIGRSPNFEEVPEGQVIPEYELFLEAGEDGNYDSAYIKKVEQ